MKIRLLFILVISSFIAVPVFADDLKDRLNQVQKGIDSAGDRIRSLDSAGDAAKTRLEELSKKISEKSAQIEAAKNAKSRKINYWIPILGGAVLGIALALWLKRKK